ncbi:MAG: hypothetical protein IMW89_16960 [Ktedonobacteraceae bacterium]|nr:hypothetical protein [Ktedonobacteraceae bacterium]
MGVERAVTRWYALHQSLLEEAALLQEKLEKMAQSSNGEVQTEVAADLHAQLGRVQERLRLLGPCPRPMMG